MKIGFDISQTAENKAGCGFFADQLIQHIAEIDGTNEYLLYPIFYDYHPADFKKATKVGKVNFTSKVIKKFDNPNDDLLGNVDIIHSNNFRFPYGNKAKKIVTIYDTSFLDYPDFTTEANRLVCLKGTYDSILFADRILTISHYTKERILHFFPSIPEHKVCVAYLGIRKSLQDAPNDNLILSRLKISAKEYWLGVGTIEPRKNFRTLLKAYSEYKSITKDYKKLCIVGNKGWLEEEFEDEIMKLGIMKDVIITGYVDEKELANLYRNAYGFIYPSWYEGFGLPVLEAMSFGVPVITSNATSIPEITLDKAILIDPKEYERITKAMITLEEDKELYCKLEIEGLERSNFFSWNKTAQEVIKLYQEVLKDE
jgi:glycosyltransferase involved in cell wall biosynthesis